MLFSLSNLKRKSLRDPDDNLVVVPKLLHGRAALKLLEQAIATFEGCVGRSRDEYDPRALEGVMGDYRLGRCIEACLMLYYSFEPPTLDSLLSAEQVSTLEEKALATPTDLRLALWDVANALHGGAVLPSERDAFMRGFAQTCDLPPDPVLIDSLLTQDSEAAALLTRKDTLPTPEDLLRLYNRGAVKTLLAHSTRVEFRLGQLPGHVLKRLYFVAKRQGVYVDIEEGEAGGYLLLLHGPEQASGGADKYGRRLADVALSLLRSLLTDGDIELPGVVATAHLLMHDRQYRFHLTPALLDRLEYAPPTSGNGTANRVAETVATYSVGSSVTAQAEDERAEEPTFDSMVEASLYREFKSLERQGHTHGWRLEREPDPLLAPGVVLIPDFAFTRGDSRVFMEIAGFWSPSYREKKLAKLRALLSSEHPSALILATPLEAASTFRELPFPIAPYKTGVRATDMLTLLDTHYGGREERADVARSHIATLQEAAVGRGFIPERQVADTLQAYTRSELLASTPLLNGNGCVYAASVGLFSEGRLHEVRALVSSLLDAHGGKADLEAASQAVADALTTPQVDLESLVQLWPEMYIERPSIFEANLVRS